MVVTKHIGRLGNNLFQIANSIGYARKYGYQWAADYGSGVGEPYSCIHQVFPNLPKADLSGRRYHEHNNEYCHYHKTHKDQCHFDYHPIEDMGPNVAFTGFYQSYKYFEHCKDEVKKVFALNHYPGLDGYVSIHVRRGDYVQHAGSFPPIDMGYILQALACITHSRDLRKIVFSDDLNWCMENLGKVPRIEFFEETDERKSLSAMASCSHHIIANSTFSWWASYLGHNANRIVISPSVDTWFGPNSGIRKPVVDLIPPNWIQIPTR